MRLGWIPVALVVVLWTTVLLVLLLHARTKLNLPAPPRASSLGSKSLLPILCNAGSRPPASLALALGGSLSAALVALVVLLEAFRVGGSGSDALNVVSVLVGLSCGVGLAVMSVVGVRECPRVHNAAAQVFMVLGVVYMGLNVALDQTVDTGIGVGVLWWRTGCALSSLGLLVVMVVCMYLETLRLQVEQHAPRRFQEEEEEERPGEQKPKLNKAVTCWAFTQYLSIGVAGVYFLSFCQPFHQHLVLETRA